MEERAFLYGENELAETTGLPLKQFQKMRAKFLQQGLDWAIKNLRVAYTQAGAQAVLEKVTGQSREDWTRVGAPFEAILADCHLELQQRAAAGGVLKAAVTRFFPNPHLLQARLENGELVNVRVKSAENFRRGMEIPVVFDPASRLYDLTRRAPRFPGRW